ncbi:hypothetical protein PYW08_003899 [Mythimna loreyi]|uniref:Uncharacterized protein n=1 Tax=Mythimna loreyi TaxID=667449 RepID=A0ACC2QU52_9NEOP|nr:hypothetical protein PYW08_003899 [Mythimna loreyi]
MDSLYDRALSEVGQEGKFQIRFDIFYNALLAGLWSLAFNNIILALTITQHNCKLPERPANLSEYLWKLKYIPIVKEATGDNGTKFSACLIFTANNDTEACSIYDYDKTWFETTIPSDNNWVCENELNVVNIFSYSKIGETVGSFVFGWLGDVYGRKPTIVISLAMLIFGRLISVLASSSFVLFTLGCVIASFPSWSVPQGTATISMEISSPKRRANVATLRLVSTSIGLCLTPLFYWWLRSWKPYMIFTTVTLMPCLLFSWKIIESPRWLLVNREYGKCIEKLKVIAKVNNTNLSSNIENDILTSGEDVLASSTKLLGPLALFSGWRLAINTTLQLLLWVCVTLNYTAVLLSSAETSYGNPFLDFAGQSIAEIPGYFVASWLADRVGRRYTGMISTTITTLIWIIYVFRDFSGTEWLQSQWLGTFLVITNRLTITVSYYIIDLLNVELYPTCLRQTGMSLGNLVSGGAAALAPYVLHLGRRFDIRYSSAILIVTTIFCGILTSFFLPETLNVKLPETLEDAQNFGRRNRNYYMSVRVKEETVDSNLPGNIPNTRH